MGPPPPPWERYLDPRLIRIARECWITSDTLYLWATQKILVTREELATIDWSLTISQESPCFYVSPVQSFWKQCEKRRNCSLRAISPFSPHCFYPFVELSVSYIVSKIFAYKLFQAWKSLKFVVWERVKYEPSYEERGLNAFQWCTKTGAW